MIWKIYKLLVVRLFECGINACLGNLSSADNDQLVQLSRVITYIRKYYGLHPAFAATTYGSLDLYLKQRLSEEDWSLLTHLQVVKSNPVQSILTIA